MQPLLLTILLGATSAVPLNQVGVPVPYSQVTVHCSLFTIHSSMSIVHCEFWSLIELESTIKQQAVTCLHQAINNK